MLTRCEQSLSQLPTFPFIYPFPLVSLSPFLILLTLFHILPPSLPLTPLPFSSSSLPSLLLTSPSPPPYSSPFLIFSLTPLSLLTPPSSPHSLPPLFPPPPDPLPPFPSLSLLLLLSPAEHVDKQVKHTLFNEQRRATAWRFMEFSHA